MRRKSGVLRFTVCFALSLLSLSGPAASPDAWRNLEDGKRLFAAGELGAALQRFQNAVAAAVTYPEGEYWIGRVFEAEGEYLLAAEQYRKAYEDRQFLVIGGDVFEILYHLAEIQKTLRQYGAYEDTLKTIIATPSRYPATPESLMPAMVASLRNRGLDRYLLLYRAGEQEKTAAFGSLGIFLYRTGRYAEATKNLLMSVTIPVTVLVEKAGKKNRITSTSICPSSWKTRKESSIQGVSCGIWLFHAPVLPRGFPLRGRGSGPGRRDLEDRRGYQIETRWAASARAQLSRPEIEPILVYPKP
jgi:hypothetical protein